MSIPLPADSRGGIVEKPQRPCESIFGERSADTVHEFVRRNVGECDGRCPLLDEAGESPLLKTEPACDALHSVAS